MAEKLTKKDLSIIVFAALGIIIFSLIYWDILFCRPPPEPPPPGYNVPVWVFPLKVLSFLTPIGVILAAVASGRKKTVKLTVKKTLLILMLVPLAVVAFFGVYLLSIIFSSLLYPSASWIISLSPLLFAWAYIVYTVYSILKARRKGGIESG